MTLLPISDGPGRPHPVSLDTFPIADVRKAVFHFDRSTWASDRFNDLRTVGANTKDWFPLQARNHVRSVFMPGNDFGTGLRNAAHHVSGNQMIRPFRGA